MNTMNGRMVTMRKDGLPYEEMGYVPPPNRKLPPVPGTPNQQSNYNTIDRIKKGNVGACGRTLALLHNDRMLGIVKKMNNYSKQFRFLTD